MARERYHREKGEIGKLGEDRHTCLKSHSPPVVLPRLIAKPHKEYDSQGSHLQLTFPGQTRLMPLHPFEVAVMGSA